MNKLVEQHMKNQLPSDPEAERILRESEKDASFDRRLKFKKGYYSIDNQEDVPLGTEYIAHCEFYAKQWFKWRDGTVQERKLYRVSDSPRIPEREDLDDRDQSKWEMSEYTNQPADPWVMQLMLPMEEPATGDIVIFVTTSIGGKRTVSDLCKNWARRRLRGDASLPIIQLQCGEFRSKRYDMIKTPLFKVVGWGAVAGPAPEKTIDVARAASKAEFDDEVPF